MNPNTLISSISVIMLLEILIPQFFSWSMKSSSLFLPWAMISAAGWKASFYDLQLDTPFSL